MSIKLKRVNIFQLRKDLAKLSKFVEQGGEVVVQRRNKAFARIVATENEFKKNLTRLGCGKGSVKILEDPFEPFIKEGEWEMLS